ncbi:hypothetical protein LI610_07090 [Lactobacillus delbrueckii subsp. indicus]|nr:hypothetical protein LI610_07090 [Lactobacillus delbrueckii subsp. indicus]KRL78527.1 hypothetical protein FC09_GL000606 [Lactobacillus delbrueckii subsp. indicus DSM 15996]
MVGALFIMLIGFGGRHKQVLLQEKRQAAIALKQKNYDQTGKSSGKTARTSPRASMKQLQA